jgi:hypothetical protein
LNPRWNGWRVAHVPILQNAGAPCPAFRTWEGCLGSLPCGVRKGSIRLRGLDERLNRVNLLPSRAGKVVIRLHLEPKTGMGSQRSLKPHGRLRPNASPAVEHIGERRARYVDVLGDLRDVHAFTSGRVTQISLLRLGNLFLALFADHFLFSVHN